MSIQTSKSALAVLKTAKEFDIYEPAIPSDEDKLIEEANWVHQQACSAYESGIKGNAVKAVIHAAELSDEPEVDEDEGYVNDVLSNTVPEIKKIIDKLIIDDIQTVEEIYSAEADGKNRKSVINYIDLQLEGAYNEPDENTGELESGDRGESNGTGPVSPWAHPEVPDEPPGGFADKPKSKFDEKFEAEEFARAKAKKLNLPLPEAPNEAPTLDHDLASRSIEELARRLNDASLCLSAATWQTSLAEIDLEHAKRVGNHYSNRIYAKEAPNAKNKEVAVAKAEDDPQVVEWRNKQAEADATYTAFRALKEIYQGHHNTISRIFAMKAEERK